jgi:hypothetical protein
VTTGGLLQHLFRGLLDGHQLGFAMGEALAHVNYLMHQGLLRRYVDNGITRYALTAPPAVAQGAPAAAVAPASVS